MSCMCIITELRWEHETYHQSGDERRVFIDGHSNTIHVFYSALFYSLAAVNSNAMLLSDRQVYPSALFVLKYDQMKLCL